MKSNEIRALARRDMRTERTDEKTKFTREDGKWRVREVYSENGRYAVQQLGGTGKWHTDSWHDILERAIDTAENMVRDERKSKNQMAAKAKKNQ